MKNELINLITDKQAHVGVIGLGYVGLPLLVEFTSKGFKGTGFEVDEAKVNQINAGTSYIAVSTKWSGTSHRSSYVASFFSGFMIAPA